MAHSTFTRFEDNIVLRHIGKDGYPDLSAMQSELEAEGYIRSLPTLSARVGRLREMGRAPINVRNSKHRVRCIDTGVEYESCSSAARAIGINSTSTITRACNESHRTAGGYHWQYV